MEFQNSYEWAMNQNSIGLPFFKDDHHDSETVVTRIGTFIAWNLALLDIFQRLKIIPCRRIRAHYEQLSEFEKGRIIELKVVGWANRRITRHVGRDDWSIRRYSQEWGYNGRFKRYDGSG
ncbi:HTH_Tnp_Tc3_2 domain-containing protein [Trichonephila clavipes]|nr:HTH_Tnp_Tc3_2 domain-containing protein [Trichonephila clavipes]